MSEIKEAQHHFEALFEDAKGRLPGREVLWVQERRRAAINRFKEVGFPSPRQEDWKYTSTRPIAKRDFGLVEREAPGLSADAFAGHTFTEPACHRLVFVDGVFAPGLSQWAELPSGVTIVPMGEALEDPPEILASHLGQYADIQANPFVALNTAFMADGVFIHLPKESVIEAPIHLLFLTTEAAEGKGSHLRNLLVAEACSEATVIEECVGLANATYLQNVVTEVAIGPGARIEQYKFQEEAPKGGFHVATFEARQSADSNLTQHNISLSGRLVRNDISTHLEGEGGHTTLNGLFLGTGRQHVDNHTWIHHEKPRCTSREYYKGVLDGYARGVYNGQVVVYTEAQQTDSDQQNKNLLLSPNAEVDPKPQLEIFADDVSCTHGATVGQLDTSAQFYLQTRGIDSESARNLLVFGFANEIIEQLQLEPVRARLEARLFNQLPNK